MIFAGLFLFKRNKRVLRLLMNDEIGDQRSNLKQLKIKPDSLIATKVEEYLRDHLNPLAPPLRI